MKPEMTVEETRASIAGEVFGESAGTPPEAKQEPKVEATPAVEIVEVDPWAGVSPVIRQEFDALREKVGVIEKIESRLKQSERRVGSLTDELHAAKEIAKATPKAPSAAEIEAAAKTVEGWEDLKEFNPGWAEAIDARIAAERAELLKDKPDVAALREELQKQTNEGISNAEAKFNGHLVSLKHPKWMEKTASPEFVAWHKEQGEPNSFDPFEVIAILDKFDAHAKSRKSTKQITAEREQRLAQSEQIPGRKLPPSASESDMSPEELRASIAKEVWR